MTPSQENHLKRQLLDVSNATRQLLLILQTEQQALCEHDVLLLETTVGEKQLCLSGLKLLESSLEDGFKQLGFDTSQGVLAQLDTLVPENVQLKESIGVVREKLEECSKLTAENALLVSTGINNVRSSLDLIRQPYEQDDATVYGPPGQELSAMAFKRDIAIV